MPLVCQDGDRMGWHHTVARFTRVIAIFVRLPAATPPRLQLV
jgi:hypothetical protein